MISKKAILSAATISMICVGFSFPSFAQDGTSTAAKKGTSTPSKAKIMSDADIDALIERLEKTGKLDSAIDAAIEKFVASKQAQQQRQQDEQTKQQTLLAKQARKVSPTRDHIYGNPKAEWSLIVYSDLECPYCKEHSGIPEETVKSIGVDKINVVFRHLPLPFHGEAAKKEAVASECVAKQAGNEGFFKFVNKILKTSQLNGQGLKGGDTELAEIAKDAGAHNTSAFAACTQDTKIQDIVKVDIADATAAGVRGTPGNIIRNNKTGASFTAHGYDRGGVGSFELRIKSIITTPHPK